MSLLEDYMSFAVDQIHKLMFWSNGYQTGEGLIAA